MKEYNFLDRVLFVLFFVLSAHKLVLSVAVLFSGTNDSPANLDTYTTPFLIAVTIYLAVRYSAIEERKQRSKYDARVEALLRRIAHNTQVKRR